MTKMKIERLQEAARKRSRYGHRDATMILITYRGRQVRRFVRGPTPGSVSLRHYPTPVQLARSRCSLYVLIAHRFFQTSRYG